MMTGRTTTPDSVVSGSKYNLITILNVIAKKSVIFLTKRSDLTLSVPQSMALQDHVRIGTNGLYRIKQTLEAFAPCLKGTVLSPNICHHVSNMERDGVVLSCIVDINCVITRLSNWRGICTFSYSCAPCQLPKNMLRQMFLDNRFELSSTFISLKHMLVVLIGFDKSDSDFIGIWRPCNCNNGNSTLFV